MVVPRANANWQAEDVEILPKLLAQCGLVVVQMEIPLPVVIETINGAYDMGVPVILNPSPAQALPDDLFKKIDTLIPNETEAEFYTGTKITDVESAKQAALALCERGPRRVVLTLGKNGALLAEDGTISHYPAYTVEALDATAAGDAFCGALAAAMLEGRSMDTSMTFAAAAGAYCVTHLGAQPSLGTLADIQKFMEEHSL